MRMKLFTLAYCPEKDRFDERHLDEFLGWTERVEEALAKPAQCDAFRIAVERPACDLRDRRSGGDGSAPVRLLHQYRSSYWLSTAGVSISIDPERVGYVVLIALAWFQVAFASHQFEHVTGDLHRSLEGSGKVRGTQGRHRALGPPPQRSADDRRRRHWSDRALLPTPSTFVPRSPPSRSPCGHSRRSRGAYPGARRNRAAGSWRRARWEHVRQAWFATETPEKVPAISRVSWDMRELR